jgi:VIT1/CCC1 family predicted Fe2+/Mn2+ transporter/rubrerythrin
MKNPKDKAIKIFRLNWLDEMRGAATYRALASQEKDESRKAILLKMAEAEERHASRWAQRLEEAGEKVPAGEVKPLRAPLLALRVADLNAALRQVEVDEHKDIRKYASQVGVLTDEASQALLKEVKQDEEGHARILEVMSGPLPRTRLESILRREKWHVSTGSWIGDAIYGVNDGLGSVFGIVSGVSGATGGSRFVLVSGLAGMIASALSMGSSAYLASKSEREVHESELAKERREISEHPEEELEELELFYQLKGLTLEEAKLLASRIARNPEEMLKTLAHEELGLSQERMPKPWTSAFSSMVSTALGAFLPVIPFFFATGIPAIVSAAAISILAHFAVGAAKSLVTARSWWASGLEMTLVAVIAGSVTYALGLLAAPLIK